MNLNREARRTLKKNGVKPQQGFELREWLEEPDRAVRRGELWGILSAYDRARSRTTLIGWLRYQLGRLTGAGDAGSDA